MSKDAYYFSHDSNARSDTKILSMRCDYGLEGYGMYWAIIEILREETDYKLKLNKHTFRALAMQMHTDHETVKKFIEDCINEYELFQSDGEEFWTESLLRRMEKAEDIRSKRRKAANKRWNDEKDQENTQETANNDASDMQNKSKSYANAMQMHSKSNASAMQSYAKEKKGKEKKGNEIKRNERKENEIKEKKIDLPPRGDEKPKKRFGKHVLLDEDEAKDLINKYGEEQLNKAIGVMDRQYEKYGRAEADSLFPCHYSKIDGWLGGRAKQKAVSLRQ